MARTTVCCLLLACLIGCQGPWQAFEEIDVGKPVPDKGILRREARKGEFEWAWGDAYGARFPVSAGHSAVRILLDKQGNVVAKEYQAMAAGHWLLFQAAAWRRVFEVKVPEYAWNDPPNVGQSPTLDEWPKAHGRRLELVSVLTPLPREGHDPRRRVLFGPDVQDSLETFIHKSAFSISRRRVAKHVLDRIDGGKRSVAVDVKKDISLDDLPNARKADWSDVKARVYVEDDPEPPTLFLEIMVPVSRPRPSNVLEWLMYVGRARDSRLPDTSRDDRGDSETYNGLSGFFANQLFGLSMYIHNGVIGLDELEDKPELFHDVTRKGFDRTYTNPWGATCRIQNLGGRRIRVEANNFVLMDTFMLLAYVKFHMMEGDLLERELEITNQDGKTTSPKSK